MQRSIGGPQLCIDCQCLVLFLSRHNLHAPFFFFFPFIHSTLALHVFLACVKCEARWLKCTLMCHEMGCASETIDVVEAQPFFFFFLDLSMCVMFDGRDFSPPNSGTCSILCSCFSLLSVITSPFLTRLAHWSWITLLGGPQHSLKTSVCSLKSLAKSCLDDVFSTPALPSRYWNWLVAKFQLHSFRGALPKCGDHINQEVALASIR